MTSDIIILTFCGAATVLLGLLILLRNARSRTNRNFALFSFSIALWTVCNYIADNGHEDVTLLFTRLTFAAGVLIAYSTLLLSQYFPNERLLEKQRTNAYYLPIAGLVVALSMTPWVISNSVKGEDGATLSIGALYYVFVGYVLMSLIAIIRNFMRQYRSAHLLVQKTQIKLVLLGIMLYALFSILSNLIVPLFVDNWTSSQYGPIFALFTVSLTAYTIIKHRLFDIRLIAVRSLAYLGSLIIFAGFYGFIVLGLILRAFGIELSVEHQTIFGLSSGIAALIFPYMRDVLNRFTNSIFYRDAYSSQDFLNDFNQQLVSTLDISKLIERTSELIAHTLKSEYCVIILTHDGDHKDRIIGTGIHKLERPELDFMHKTHDAKSLIVADHLTYEDEKIQHAMHKNNIAVIAHLDSRGQSEPEVGHLVLGPKKSGNTYTSQDIAIIETIANELVIAIQNALRFEEIERFNATLQQRVDEATRKLRRTNEKLRQLDETKDDFISMASHQLRTPLTSVKGYVSMVVEGDAGELNPMQKKLLSQAFISAQRMVYLISDLLNVSRLRTGKFIIEPVQSNLANIVQEEVKQLIPTAKGRGLELVYHRPEHFPILMFDETKMRQVIMNFIDNAIYYTPTGGNITVSIVDKPTSIEFTVTDTGIGVPKADQHHLFSKFYRANNAKRARPDGTGLGLFMAKKVIVAQGGATIFKSQEGKGSTFGFTFNKEPLTPTRPPESHVLKH